jgi:signal transduction histidine kinase
MMNSQSSSSNVIHSNRHEINNRLGTLALAIEILQQNPAPDVRDLARKMESELETLQRLLREMLPSH